MQTIFDNDHAEIVPQEDLRPDKLCWYLTHFGEYHPKKKDKIRVVFDSAAESHWLSLNKLLFSGPDLTNNLLGVLLRFRQDLVPLVGALSKCFTLSR